MQEVRCSGRAWGHVSAAQRREQQTSWRPPLHTAGCPPLSPVVLGQPLGLHRGRQALCAEHRHSDELPKVADDWWEEGVHGRGGRRADGRWVAGRPGAALQPAPPPSPLAPCPPHRPPRRCRWSRSDQRPPPRSRRRGSRTRSPAAQMSLRVDQARREAERRGRPVRLRRRTGPPALLQTRRRKLHAHASPTSDDMKVSVSGGTGSGVGGGFTAAAAAACCGAARATLAAASRASRPRRSTGCCCCSGGCCGCCCTAACTLVLLRALCCRSAAGAAAGGGGTARLPPPSWRALPLHPALALAHADIWRAPAQRASVQDAGARRPVLASTAIARGQARDRLWTVWVWFSKPASGPILDRGAAKLATARSTALHPPSPLIAASPAPILSRPSCN